MIRDVLGSVVYPTAVQSSAVAHDTPVSVAASTPAGTTWVAHEVPPSVLAAITLVVEAAV
jgi:hypothetical protein